MKRRPKHMRRQFWWHLSRSQRKALRGYQANLLPGVDELYTEILLWDEQWWKP